MNKFNFRSRIMTPVMEIVKSELTPEPTKEPVLTAQEKREDEQYKEEQEITHEADPEKEKYLPAEKFLKKLNKSKRGKKKKRVESLTTLIKVVDDSTPSESLSKQSDKFSDGDIERLIRLLKKK